MISVLDRLLNHDGLYNGIEECVHIESLNISAVRMSGLYSVQFDMCEIVMPGSESYV